MDACTIIRALLVADGSATRLLIDPAAVPSPITTDVLAQGVTLPAIEIEEIGSNDLNIPNPGARRRVRTRVQVRCIAESKPDLVQLVEAVRSDCADRLPTVAGLTSVTVHTAGAGPDGYHHAIDARAKTQDFWVSYNELR